jgi:hypothetical protein
MATNRLETFDSDHVPAREVATMVEGTAAMDINISIVHPCVGTKMRLDTRSGKSCAAISSASNCGSHQN